MAGLARVLVRVLVLVGLAVPVVVQAQVGEPAGTDPVARLLEHRSELALSAEQVRNLETIQRRTQDRDGELRARIGALRGQPLGERLLVRERTVAERERLAANRAELVPLMRQLRASHAEAITEARAVLTPEQNERAAAYLFRGPGQGLGRGPAAGPAGGPAAGGRGWGRAWGWRGGGEASPWRGGGRWRSGPGAWQAP
jgi:hypothetical protein